MIDLLEQIEQEEKELREKLAGLQERKKSIPFEINVSEIQLDATKLYSHAHSFDARVRVKLTYPREDILNTLKPLRTRFYDPKTSSNTIGISEFNAWRFRVEEFDNVKLTYKDDKIKEKVENYLSCKLWELKLDKEKNIITGKLAYRAGSGFASKLLNGIPGYKINLNSMLYQFPLTEGWRVLETLEQLQRVDYSIEPELLELIKEQIAEREKLSNFQSMEDYDIKVELNGHELRPFQRVGLAFANHAGGRCIIADQPGLGKTPQSLAYCEYNKDTIKHTLIIVPALARGNWVAEIRKFTGEEPDMIVTAEPGEIDIIKLLKFKKRYTVVNYDLLARATVYDTKKTIEHLGQDVEVLHNNERYLWIELINKANFDCVIIDEAHYLKNMESNRSIAIREISAPHILHLTGTPVLNRPGELYPLVSMLNPKIFPSYGVFMNQYSDGKNGARNVEQLRKLVEPLMIRRLKKDVKKDLPPIERIYKYTQLNEKARRIYEKIKVGIIETPMGDMLGNTHILSLIQKMKQVCVTSKVQPVADFAVELYDESEGNDYRKVLIFSQYIFSAEAIHRRLGAESLLITGQIDKSDRLGIVNRFQNEKDIHFLVCSTKAASEALNITAAGSVIFTDLMWTPAAHEQAEGRAYGREGDSHGIDSYYFLAENTIEDWIFDLLNEKMSVIDEVVDGKVTVDKNVSVFRELMSKIKKGA